MSTLNIEIQSIVNELVDRIVLSETFPYTFHPDHHPLIKPLGKRSREDEEQPNKRQRTDSMDTQYDPDEMTEDMLPLHFEDNPDWESQRNEFLGMTTWRNKQHKNDCVNIFDDGAVSVCIAQEEGIY